MLKFETDVSQPDLTAGTPAEVWDRFFTEHRPAPRLVSEWVTKLHQAKNYKQVIACLEAALLHGQAQPWMYEVLALNMEIEQYPKEAIERVVLSLTDFGDVDFGSMMFSGAYLTRFGRKAAALKLYQQAARILPERAEPYLLGLKLAREAGTPEDVKWAAAGILQYQWGTDYVEKHKLAEAALQDEIQKARKKNDPSLAQSLQAAFLDARSRDLSIRLDWNGAADLDMQVEEPGGTVCSVETPETRSGGMFLHDGVGPTASNAYEQYLCPRGFSGPYRIRIKNADGVLVGNRATLTVTIREGLTDQSRFVRTLVIEGNEVGLTVDLPNGRRVEPRVIVSASAPPAMLELQPWNARQGIGGQHANQPGRQQAMSEFQESRATPATVRKAGAVGYAPVVQVIPEGTGMSAQATISPDRRYIRLGIQPVFNDVTDTFTFTYLNSGNK